MSQLGTLHHFAICVSDMKRSEEFYASILEHLGYASAQRMKDTSIRERVGDAVADENEDSFIIWTGSGGAISMWPVNPDTRNKQYEMYSPGLHHFALAADSREQVDSLYKHLKKIGAEILNEPQEYDYLPGYYAVFFADPDGVKLELCHTPDFPPG